MSLAHCILILISSSNKNSLYRAKDYIFFIFYHYEIIREEDFGNNSASEISARVYGECVLYRDVRVQILIWFQTFLLFTKLHFQTSNALKSTSQAFQIISYFFRLFLTVAFTPLVILTSKLHWASEETFHFFRSTRWNPPPQNSSFVDIDKL